MIDRLKIIFFIGLILIIPIFSESLSFDMTDEAQDVNEKIDYESSKISHKQQKAIGKFLGFDKPVNYTIESAESYCYYIKDAVSRNGCLSGIKLARDDISGAESYCYYMKDADSRNGCLSGIKLARDDISGAESYCYYIKDADSRNGCLSGIKLAKDDISGAESYCYYIKDADSKNGCLSGIKLAKDDISGAESYCYYIKDADSRNGCLSDVALTGYFIKQAENNENDSNYEVNQIEEDITKINKELLSDKAEALEMIKELESCPECLEDKETKKLYLQLKGDL